jgi:hypothetical protein
VWCFLKRNRTSVVWVVAVWMVTMLLLALIGPVVHL